MFKRLYNYVMLEYWKRYYLRKFKENPDDPEIMEMAVKTGMIREHQAAIERLKRNK